MYYSIEKRLVDVAKAKGGPTKYWLNEKSTNRYVSFYHNKSVLGDILKDKDIVLVNS